MEILLNGKKYITERVQRQPIQPFAPAQAQAATSARQNILLRDWYSIRAGIGGFGNKRTNDNPPKRLFTSTCDTRWPDVITNARLRTSTAVTGNEDLVKALVSMDDTLYAYGQRPHQAAALNSIRIGPLNMASGRAIGWGANNTGARAFSMVRFGKYLIACGNDVTGTETDLRIFYWDPTTGNGTLAGGHQNGLPSSLTTTVTRRDNYTDFGGTLLTFGNTLFLLAYIWDGSTQATNQAFTSGTMLVMRTDDPVSSTGQWYVHGLISMGGAAPNAVVWRNTEGKAAPVFAGPDGIYSVGLTSDNNVTDALNPVIEKILELPPHNDNGRGLAVYESDLMVTSGHGKVLQVGQPKDGIMTARDVTPDFNLQASSAAGLPFYASAGYSCNRWYYMGYSSGGNGNTSHVLAWDGREWHYISKVATASTTGLAKEVTALGYQVSDDSLVFYEPGGDNYFSIAVITAAPDSGVVIQYETSSVLEVPEYDGGLPEEASVWLQVYANFDSTAGTITPKYGLDGAASETTALSNLTGAAPTTTFGSGAGVSGRRIRMQLTLNGASATDPIKLHEFVVGFLKIPITRYMYKVVVDVEASAREFQRTRENIISELETVMDTVTMLLFQYSQAAAVRVKAVPPWVWSEETGEASGWSMQAQADRTGYVEVMLVKLL